MNGLTLHKREATGRPFPARSRSGFTLIELLVTIAILAILIGLLLPSLVRVRLAAQKSLAQSHLKELAGAMFQHRDHFGDFPATTQQLAESPFLPDPFTWDGAELRVGALDRCYALEFVDRFSFTLCSRPKAPFNDGSFVFCLHASLFEPDVEIVEELPDEEAAADQAARERLATLIALDTTARLLTRADDDDKTASEVRPLLAAPEITQFALAAVDHSGDAVITKEEMMTFMAPKESDAAALAEMKEGLRDAFAVLRLHQGEYEGVRIADVQGDPAALFSPENLKLYIHAEVDHPGIAASLSAKSDAADLARRLEPAAAKEACAAIIGAFRRELAAQVFKSIAAEDAVKLHALIGVQCPTPETSESE
jgi:prepilin-type N-terminal cleavage/methylation domain-containing protein